MKELLYPRQVILVSCRADIQSKFSPDIITKDNIFTLSWHTPISTSPNQYAIVVGKNKLSYKLIHESKVFVVNFIDIKHQEAALFCGTNHGDNIDKFKETKLTKEEAEQIECCRIKEALGFLECNVIQEVELGDHVIFIGEVIYFKENKKGNKIFQKQTGSYEFTTTK